MTDTQRLTHDEAVKLAAPYVLAALEPDEEAAVREHLRTCPESHAEFEEVGSVVPALAEAVEPVEPPAALKSRILRAAAAERTGPAPVVGTQVLASASAPAPVGLPVPIDSRRRGPGAVSWFLVAAAGIAVVALVAVNLLTLGRLNASEQFARDVAAVIDTGAQPGAVTAVLAPTETDGPRGLASVGPDGTVTMALQDLTPTTGNEVYEGWAIVGEAAPVPLGGFTVGDSGTGRLDGTGPPAEPGMTIALTLERSPGAQTPTLPILTAGVAGSGAAP